MTARFDSAKMMQWIKDQTDLGPRRPGSPAGHKQEDYLLRKLTDFGLQNARKEPIDVIHWEPQETRFEVCTPTGWRQVACFPIPYAAFTAPLTGRLVWGDAPGWEDADWRGAIVMADIHFPMLDARMLRRISLGEVDLHDTLKDVKHPATWIRLGWHMYRRAIQKGAAGFVGILRDQPGGTCRMYAPYGFREHDILDKPLPGAWVSKADGDELQQLALTGSSARLTSTGTRRPSVTHNVIAEIPGTSKETVVLTCHHDTPFRSPVEDASGVTTVLAIAEHLAKAKTMQRRVLVVLTAGHFYGSIGTRTFIEQHKRDILPDVALTLSIEHIAKEAVENQAGKLVATGRAEPAGVFLSFNQAIKKLLLTAAAASGVDRWVLLPAEGPLGNYPPTDGGDWYAAGIPIVNYISNPVYLLTDDDADAWIDQNGLQQVAAAFTNFLTALDATPRATLSRCDFPLRRRIMQALRLVMQAKTTSFGRKPVH